MSQIQFFAAGSDILPVLKCVEKFMPLQYVSTTSIGMKFSRGSEIPDLGSASASATYACERYLVAEQGASILPRIVATTTGTRVIFDQLINPNTIAITFGGVWTDDIVICGEVGTVSHTEPARLLMRRFSAAFKKEFVKVRAALVGPHAMELLRVGKRLTNAATALRDDDLSPL